MATDAASIEIARKWLHGLHELCIQGKEGRLTNDRATHLARSLLEVLPSSAFTAASQRECAKGDFFPGFDTLQTRLTEWWSRNKPGAKTQASLPQGVDASNLNASDRHFLDYWYEHRPARAEQENAIRASGKFRDETQLPLARLASLIRNHSPKAWAVITGSAAVGRVEPSQADRDAVSEAAARVRRAITEGARPPPRPATFGEQLAAARALPVPTREPVPVDPAILAAARDANPIVQAARQGSGIKW